MKKLPALSGRNVLKVLQKLGFKVVGKKGSHVRLKKKSDEVRIVLVPLHKEIKKGTLNSIVRQAGLKKEEFLKLV